MKWIGYGPPLHKKIVIIGVTCIKLMKWIGYGTMLVTLSSVRSTVLILLVRVVD